MKKYTLFNLLLPFIIISIPWIYLLIIWKELPVIIPTHFSLEGKPDAFGEKSEIVIAPSIMTVIGIFIYFLLKNIYKIDPKKKYASTTSTVLSKMSVVVLLLLSGVTISILYWTMNGKVEGMPLLFCGLSLFFAYIGNLMYSIKPNYFVGFRIPWTLENEDNWNKTHRFASKLWFFGGIILALLSLLIEIRLLLIVFFSTVLLMSIIPAIYSHIIYKQSANSRKPR
jgi:uncharacterized membrane protein